VVEIPRESLVRRWVHSHEEDTDTEMVFRPDDFDFPPSRGRVALELKKDGTALERGIGPTDVPQETERRWTVDPDGSIVLLEKGTDRILRRLPVESADPDRLTVRK
jgi:hypothetical protein